MKLEEYNEVDLTLHNYKEPLTPVEDGFGFYGTISATKDGAYIQCHICGDLFANMGSHIKNAHKILGREYKEKFGLKYTSALISENERLRLKQKQFDYLNSLSPEEKAAMYSKARQAYLDRGRAKRDRTGQPEETLESKNIKGTCPDQLLDKIVQVSRELGSVPSKRDFIKHLGTQRYVHLIYKTFGSWSEAVRMTGLTPKPLNHRVGAHLRYTDEQLLEYLRVYVRANKKIPAQSDYYRGLLPAMSTYTNRFGSLQDARELAGVPEMMESFEK